MHVLKHLLHYVLQRKTLAVSVLIFIFIAQITELSIPILVGVTIDQILLSITEERFEIAIVLTGVMLIIIASVIRGVTYFLGRWIGYLQGERIIYDIRKDLFNKYETSSLEFFDTHHTGDLMARATTDLEPISEFLVWGERILLQAFLTYVGIYLVLYIIDIRLFLLIGIVTPTLFILSYFVSTKLGPLFFDIRQQYGKLTTVIQENIAGTQIVKAFNAEDREKTKFDKENFTYFDLRAYAFKIRSVFLPMILFVVNLLITILIFAGGYLVIQGDISPGLLITLFTYFIMLAMPTRFLAFSLIMYQRVSAAGDRVFTLLEAPTHLPEVPKAERILENISPTIIFDKVSFSYKDRQILSNISLTINSGEKIAILGPTGSGKTTIISLIPRFYDPNIGRILLKTGQKTSYDLRDLDLKAWRQKVGFVHQEPFLFGRTISENIAFGVPEATIEQINKVVKITQLDEFISNLPDGLETIIGERGVTLSGGQKQRVAIARMLLRKCPIMILDDATSSLDISTEARFQEAFEEYLDGLQDKQTVIFITQRLSTLKIVDRIIILNRGQIIEQGTHEELLEKGQIYPLLWKTQELGMVDIKLALEKIIQERS
ncbi:MAG: ABC transporter ATP-binding protein [Candidatus Heimdallarchaeota archaeon]|nr:MAG: ABC transporter ATP-binding protein [Candidatus Heimdallarchaeota archaeon]